MTALRTKNALFAHNCLMLWVLKKGLGMLGNFYWKIVGGLLLPLIWFIVSTAFLCTVIGTPLALKGYRIAWTIFKPFGKEVAIVPDKPVLSFLWGTTAGFFIGTVAIINALASFLTIAGLPFAKQWYKAVLLSFFPFCTRVL